MLYVFVCPSGRCIKARRGKRQDMICMWHRLRHFASADILLHSSLCVPACTRTHPYPQTYTNTRSAPMVCVRAEQCESVEIPAASEKPVLQLRPPTRTRRSGLAWAQLPASVHPSELHICCSEADEQVDPRVILEDETWPGTKLCTVCGISGGKVCGRCKQVSYCRWAC